MNIMVENVVAGVPVTVLRLEGELDASNYRQLITQTDSLYRDGTRHLLVDLSELAFLSSSGLVALHSTDPASVHLSALARMRQPSIAAIERALYETRSLVRMRFDVNRYNTRPTRAEYLFPSDAFRVPDRKASLATCLISSASRTIRSTSFAGTQRIPISTSWCAMMTCRGRMQTCLR